MWISSATTVLCALLSTMALVACGDLVEHPSTNTGDLDGDECWLGTECNERIFYDPTSPHESEATDTTPDRFKGKLGSLRSTSLNSQSNVMEGRRQAMFQVVVKPCLQGASFLEEVIANDTAIRTAAAAFVRELKKSYFHTKDSASFAASDSIVNNMTPTNVFSSICLTIAVVLDESLERHSKSKSEAARVTAEAGSVFKKRKSEEQPLLDSVNQVLEERQINPRKKVSVAGQSSMDPSTVEAISEDSVLCAGADSTTVQTVKQCNPVSASVPGVEAGPGFVGSVRGIPGVHFPNYSEIPITSFSCSDKLVPRFYADLETGCQVFHVCYEHRRESFLCPVGTIFNQPVLACDYWYSSNCSQAEIYYERNERPQEKVNEEADKVDILIATIPDNDMPKKPKIPSSHTVEGDLAKIAKFLPVKAKILEFPVVAEPKVKPTKDFDETAARIFEGLLFAGTQVVAKAQDSIGAFSETGKVLPVVKTVPLIKSKLALKSAIPDEKAKLLSAAAIPVKAKLVSSGAEVPIKKAKLASIVAIPKVKSKFAALPLAKAKYAAASVPVMKMKTAAKISPVVKTAAIKPKFVVAPIKVKSAAVAIPLAKVKALSISPLTKKALALGYLKLLKAKKMALVG